MRVRWDSHRSRLLAGGNDGTLKIFQLDEDNVSLRLSYKLKLPAELTSLDISTCGNHLAIGLSTGSLIVKSKNLEKEKDEVQEEQKIMSEALVDNFVSKAKGYKYFFRGQYTPLMPDA